MLSMVALMAWGAAGATVYAGNALILNIWNDGSTTAARHRAIAEFMMAVVTGAVASAGLTNAAWNIAMHGLVLGEIQLKGRPDPVALALTIGWSSNYLWPKILRLIGAWVEKKGERS